MYPGYSCGSETINVQQNAYAKAFDYDPTSTAPISIRPNSLAVWSSSNSQCPVVHLVILDPNAQMTGVLFGE